MPFGDEFWFLELSTAVLNRQKLESQLQENTFVQKVFCLETSCWYEEFASLSPDAKIFKAHGPVLLQQSLDEANDMVGKRLEYIRKEIDRVEVTLKELESKGQKVRSEILSLSDDTVKLEGRS